MVRPVRMALQFMAIVAAIGVASTLFAPSRAERNPYFSGLSDLTVGLAYASHAPGCEHKVCKRYTGSNPNGCTRVTRNKNCALTSTSCTNVDC